MDVIKISISPPHSSPGQAMTEETPSHVLAKAHALYTTIKDDDLALAEEFLAIATETLPPYQAKEKMGSS